MNDATRELGAALGIAVLGSVAATKYSTEVDKVTIGLGPDVRHQFRVSLANALHAASRLPQGNGHIPALGAQRAFLDGIHLAAVTGAVLAVVASATVLRFLPHELYHHGPVHGSLEALEDTAELGIAGVPPAR